MKYLHYFEDCMFDIFLKKSEMEFVKFNHIHACNICEIQSVDACYSTKNINKFGILLKT